MATFKETTLKDFNTNIKEFFQIFSFIIFHWKSPFVMSLIVLIFPNAIS